jgi:hypothetical protein
MSVVVGSKRGGKQSPREVLSKAKREGGLGFHDFHGFNMAMLARQAWRMLTNLGSLCARVLKARYFPNVSILEAIASNGISYTWRTEGMQASKGWPDLENRKWGGSKHLERSLTCKRGFSFSGYSPWTTRLYEGGWTDQPNHKCIGWDAC